MCTSKFYNYCTELITYSPTFPFRIVNIWFLYTKYVSTFFYRTFIIQYYFFECMYTCNLSQEMFKNKTFSKGGYRHHIHSILIAAYIEHSILFPLNAINMYMNVFYLYGDIKCFENKTFSSCIRCNCARSIIN